MIRRHFRTSLTALLFAVAAVMFGHGAWIYVKARIAQTLLHVAWRRTLAGAHGVRPWPWADTTTVARIHFDRDGSDSIVLAGTTGRTLAFAPGHMDASAGPGDDGNCVISAHRDTQFAALRTLVRGDIIRLERPDRRVAVYRVEATRVIDRSELAVATPTPDSRLTLITCWPFEALVAGGRRRYVVTALRVSDTHAQATFRTFPSSSFHHPIVGPSLRRH